MTNPHWQAGRLTNGTEPLSIDEAYHLIPERDAIAEACDGVLGPYKRKNDDLK